MKQHFFKSCEGARISSSFAIAIAVSLASPVIIITPIPAVLHAWIEGFTSSRHGSLMQTYPRKAHPPSRYWYDDTSESKSCEFSAVISFIFPPSRPIAIPRTLNPSPATFLMWVFISSLSLSLSSTCYPTAFIYFVHLSMTISGAPFRSTWLLFWP